MGGKICNTVYYESAKDRPKQVNKVSVVFQTKPFIKGTYVGRDVIYLSGRDGTDYN